nr:unnamed protein product [Callosobruchus chinensis]
MSAQHLGNETKSRNPQATANTILWFQQDGDADEFPNRWIGRRGSVECSARPPDLTPLLSMGICEEHCLDHWEVPNHNWYICALLYLRVICQHLLRKKCIRSCFYLYVNNEACKPVKSNSKQ